MAVCTQKMIRQLAKVTMIPPIQGPVLLANTQLQELQFKRHTNGRPSNAPNHKETNGCSSNNLHTPSAPMTLIRIGEEKRSTGSKISARIVCPETMNDVPVNPARVLIVVNMRILIAAAAPAEHPVSTKIATLYAYLRPRILPSGPQISDEKPIASSTPAFVALRISVVVLNSEAISGVAGRKEVEEKVMARVIQLTTKRIIHLRQVGRLYWSETSASRAFSGAPGAAPAG